MAALFDQKEEVLSVELTNYGRKLLAQGKFSVDSYLFFDDSVIYDDGNNEPQNNIKNRLLNDSLTMRAATLQYDAMELASIGTSDIFSNYAPSWDIMFLNGTYTYVSESSSYFKKKFDIEDSQTVLSLDTTNVTNTQNFNNSILELDDGRIITIDNGYILIDLQEINVTDDFQNFDIQVYTYDELYGGEEYGYKRNLTFTEKPSNIIDGIIYEDTELPQKYADIKLSKDSVEYYLDILVDDEIDTQLISAKEQIVRDQFRPTYAPNAIDKVKDDC